MQILIRNNLFQNFRRRSFENSKPSTQKFLNDIALFWSVFGDAIRPTQKFREFPEIKEVNSVNFRRSKNWR